VSDSSTSIKVTKKKLWKSHKTTNNNNNRWESQTRENQLKHTHKSIYPSVIPHKLHAILTTLCVHDPHPSLLVVSFPHPIERKEKGRPFCGLPHLCIYVSIYQGSSSSTTLCMYRGCCCCSLSNGPNRTQKQPNQPHHHPVHMSHHHHQKK
jgi:hypothetical protein